VATAVVARLERAGVTVGKVITDRAATSAVDYPAGRRDGAARLARALGVVAAARPARVDRITVVLGARDAGGLDCTG
jgi:LytR cell envelope-related transcriptional attenuator